MVVVMAVVVVVEIVVVVVVKVVLVCDRVFKRNFSDNRLLVGKYESADDVPPGRARSRLFCGSGPRARPQQRHGEPGLEVEMFDAIRFAC